MDANTTQTKGYAMEELLKLFEGKPELGHEVETLWARGASAQEVADALSSNGVYADAAQIEELLSAMQARRAAVIGEGEKIDKDQLKNVAGGWCAFWQSAQGSGDSCSMRFKEEAYKDVDPCFWDSYCDYQANYIDSGCAFDKF